MGAGGIGVWKLVIILGIVMLLFGGKRLRTLGGDLGTAIKGFKSSMAEESISQTTEQLDLMNQDVLDIGKNVQASNLQGARSE